MAEMILAYVNPYWLPYTVGIALGACLVSIAVVRWYPDAPFRAFGISVAVLLFGTYLAIGARQGGLFMGGEALFWTLFGVLWYTPLALTILVVTQLVLRGGRKRRQ
jgi:hypothetical protein